MNPNSQTKHAAALWGLAAVALSIVICTVNNSPLVTQAGFFLKVLAVLAGSALGTVCAVIADAIRRAIHPDFVITNGGFFSLLWAKVFWAIGPQVIGVVCGCFFGVALVLK